MKHQRKTTMKTSRDSRFIPAAPREGRSGLLHPDQLGGGRLARRQGHSADDGVPAPPGERGASRGRGRRDDPSGTGRPRGPLGSVERQTVGPLDDVGGHLLQSAGQRHGPFRSAQRRGGEPPRGGDAGDGSPLGGAAADPSPEAPGVPGRRTPRPGGCAHREHHSPVCAPCWPVAPPFTTGGMR